MAASKRIELKKEETSFVQHLASDALAYYKQAFSNKHEMLNALDKLLLKAVFLASDETEFDPEDDFSVNQCQDEGREAIVLAFAFSKIAEEKNSKMAREVQRTVTWAAQSYMDAQINKKYPAPRASDLGIFAGTTRARVRLTMSLHEEGCHYFATQRHEDAYKGEAVSAKTLSKSTGSL